MDDVIASKHRGVGGVRGAHQRPDARENAEHVVARWSFRQELAGGR
jgi:hypothetical protein